MVKSRDRNLMRYAHHFFPPGVVRDAVQPGVHFTEDALRQMTPYRKARAIVDLIAAHMPRHFNVLEVCAGVGGNTMAFAKCAAVKAIVSYESDPAVADMLEANLRLTRTAGRVAVQREAADTAGLVARATTSGQAVAVFVDPPWGLVPPYHDPLTTPLNGAGECVADWVAALLACPRVRLLVVKVPAGYSHNCKIEGVAVQCHRGVAKMNMLLFRHDAAVEEGVRGAVGLQEGRACASVVVAGAPVH